MLLCSIIHVLQAQSTCAEITTAHIISVPGEECRITAAVSGSFDVSFKLENHLPNDEKKSPKCEVKSSSSAKNKE